MHLSVHHALFVLLPLALAARQIIKPRPSPQEVAHGALRFCLGFAKWALLVSPLWHLSGLILRGGVESLTTGMAWIGLLAQILVMQFVFTGTGDVLAGLGGMLGFKPAEAMQEVLTLRRFTQGRHTRLLPLLALLALVGMVLQTLPSIEIWPHLKALAVSPPRTVATVFQEARAWSDYHVITLLGGLTCLIGLPHSRDFLREPAPWKAVVCLAFFVLAVAIEWTRNAPMS